jgi:hypothetical protein
MTLAYLHPGDLTLADWVRFLAALTVLGLLILGIAVALFVFLIRHFEDKGKTTRQ